MADDTVTGVDGTYEPIPPPLLADPLSGLVTGLNLPAQRRDEFDIPRIAAPRLPDASEVQEVMDAMLHAENAARPEPAAPEPEPEPAKPEPTGMLRQWPAAAEVARKLRATINRPRQVPEIVRKPAGARTGITVVLVILLVTVVILYFVITSLAETFGRLFG